MLLSSVCCTCAQERNAAGRMFGGFLMKCAFELAFATAYTSGGRRPLFKEVDEIAFLQPVGE
jgi:acyl-coenzyme A thioesterase 9